MTLSEVIREINEEKNRTSKNSHKHPVKGKQLKNYLKINI